MSCDVNYVYTCDLCGTKRNGIDHHVPSGWGDYRIDKYRQGRRWSGWSWAISFELCDSCNPTNPGIFKKLWNKFVSDKNSPTHNMSASTKNVGEENDN